MPVVIVIAASGTFGYGIEYARIAQVQRLGAVICKGTTLHPRSGNAQPRTHETSSGMLNAIGLQNPGIHIVINKYAPIWETWQTPVIVNIAGESIKEFVQLLNIELNDPMEGWSRIFLVQRNDPLMHAIADPSDERLDLKQALAVQDRAGQIRQRTVGLTDLLTRWGALGEAAAEVNRLVQQVAATSQKAGAEKQLGAAAFRDIDDRLGRLAQDSEELAQAAQADAFVELGRQAESLRQQLLSARNKFRLLERRRGSAGEP